MLVVCKVKECYYHSPSDLCKKNVVFLNSGGNCCRIYNNNGQVKQNWNDPPDFFESKKEEQKKEIEEKDKQEEEKDS